MNYDDYIEQLACDTIGNYDGSGLLIRMLHESFEKEEYYSIRDRFIELNEAALRGELNVDQIIDALSLSYIFYIRMLLFYNENASQEFVEVAFDAEKTFGRKETL